MLETLPDHTPVAERPVPAATTTPTASPDPTAPIPVVPKVLRTVVGLVIFLTVLFFALGGLSLLMEPVVGAR